MNALQPLVFSFGSIGDLIAHPIPQPIDLEGTKGWSATLEWTGGAVPAGTLTAYSTDFPDAGPTDISLCQLFPAAAIAGNSGAVSLRDYPAPYRKLVFVLLLTGGSATFTLAVTRRGK